MANEHRIKQFLLNYDAGVYTAGQIDTFTYSGGQFVNMFGVDNKLQFIDMTFYKNKVTEILSNYTPSTYPSIYTMNGWFGTLYNGEIEPHSDNWHTAIEKFNSLFVWIYGSVEKGGLAIGKWQYNDTNYTFFVCSGLYTNGTKHRYACGTISGINSSIQNIAVCYRLYGKINTENAGYHGYIEILRDATDAVKAYDGYYDGSVNMRFMYDTQAPITGSTLPNMITGACNNWVAESLLAELKIPQRSIKMDSVGVGNTVYVDDEHTPVSGWIYEEGHWYGGDIVSPDENNNDGGNGGQGGGGNNDDTNNPLGKTLPTQFGNDAFGTGFIQAYNPTKAELLSLANILCTGVSKNISLMLKKLFTNPLDYIVALNMCHFSVSTSTAETVKLGGWDTGIAMNVIEKQYYFLNGGSVEIKPDHGNFLDYSPYTRCKIFVPYCGIHELPVDLVMSGTLSIQYIIDTLTGAMVAELYLSRDRKGILRNVEQAQTDGYMWSFSGNCFTPIPIGNLDYRNAINSILGLVSGVGTTIATGNPMPIAGAVANGVMNSKPDFQMGSNIGSNFGYMTAQEPFIILQNTVQNRPYNFIDWKGYPSNTLKPISSYSGYLECDTDTFWCGSYTTELAKPITEQECEEIRNILTTGIWV